MNIRELDDPQSCLPDAHLIFFNRQAVRFHKDTVSRQQSESSKRGHDCFFHLFSNPFRSSFLRGKVQTMPKSPSKDLSAFSVCNVKLIVTDDT